MSKIQLYIATTIDGYIARKNNSLDWLYELPPIENEDYGYAKFYSGIDVVAMGRSTYEEILGFDVDWPYQNCKCVVITSKKDYQTSTDNTVVMNQIDSSSIEQIRQLGEKNVWVVGGGRVITSFLNEQAIDEMILTQIPRILGDGIQLFPDQPLEQKFELLSAESYKTGVVNLHYKKA